MLSVGWWQEYGSGEEGEPPPEGSHSRRHSSPGDSQQGDHDYPDSVRYLIITDNYLMIQIYDLYVDLHHSRDAFVLSVLLVFVLNIVVNISALMSFGICGKHFDKIMISFYNRRTHNMQVW